MIELIVAVGIIGVLAAIAIPQYSGYKKRAVDSQMQSALKNARTSMEAYYADFSEYPGVGSESLLLANGYRPGADVELDIVSVTGIEYKLRACSPGGSFESFEYDTTVGRMLGNATACT